MGRNSSLVLALIVALGAIPAWSADHRDTGALTDDPNADITDLYVFRSPAVVGRMVLSLSVNGFTPREAAATMAFSPDVAYRFHVDNNADSIEDIVITFRFGPRLADGRQTATCSVVGGGSPTTFSGFTTPPTAGSTPSLPATVTDPGDNNRLFFCGPREDPFFFDLPAFQRVASGAAAAFRNPGIDSFAGKNVSSIVFELPAGQLTNGPTTIGVWATTARSSVRLLRSTRDEVTRGSLIQIDRMGRPAINTVLVPSSLKNAFNRGQPANDRAVFKPSVKATILALNPGGGDANAESLANFLLPDILTLDTATPTAFPNGRFLADDVIDTELGLLLPSLPTDNVAANDVLFLATFPYLAQPFQP